MVRFIVTREISCEVEIDVEEAVQQALSFSAYDDGGLTEDDVQEAIDELAEEQALAAPLDTWEFGELEINGPYPSLSDLKGDN